MSRQKLEFPEWVRLRYEAGENLKLLAKQLGVGVRTIQRRATQERWKRKRGQLPVPPGFDDSDPDAGEPPEIDASLAQAKRELEQAQFLIEEARRQAPAQYLAMLNNLKARFAAWLNANPPESNVPLGQQMLAIQIVAMLANLEDRITGFMWQPAVEENKTLEIHVIRTVAGDIGAIDTSDPAAADLQAEEAGDPEPPEPN